ncbi:palmitoyltransferase YKT6 [Aspergillus affinis]|uniref:palmitoyltransferase YKT6 n=1 Tax=Aspergillus affinis TaxID=1070780 RepID=UPI0022FDD924|nr:putative snare protein Ykt6 [Aspergillus affinis]KAI9035864.1 putative snare protein Ykt6 [Aspergillus affinis]
MKLLYIGIINNGQQPAVELCAERELSSYSRFTRSNISEFMTMFSKTVAERTKQGQRQDIEEQGKLSSLSPVASPYRPLSTILTITSFTDFTFHVYARTQNIAAVIISDKEYPSLAAHQILSKALDEFLAQHPNADSSRNPVTFAPLRTYITTYQDPQQVDSIMKIQKELDETKIVLHKTIESVLERGEKIDDLVTKSEGLSAQSKMFYTSAKKQNSCCVIC